MIDPEQPKFIGYTPVVGIETNGGKEVLELADLMPNGIVEPNSALAMSIARKIREQRAARSFSLRKQDWKDRSFIPGDY